MNESEDRPHPSLKHEVRSLLRTNSADARHLVISPPRLRFGDALMHHQARLGAEVVEAVARDSLSAASGERIAVTRAQDGRYWEFAVLRDGVPSRRVVAALRRSLKPPWRLSRLTYFTLRYPPVARR